jgi:hypothetical protein
MNARVRVQRSYIGHGLNEACSKGPIADSDGGPQRVVRRHLTGDEAATVADRPKGEVRSDEIGGS